MAPAISKVRRFHAHARHLDPGHGLVVEGATFEAAAAAYLEDLGAAPPEEAEIRVIVRDLEDGREHCFVVEIGTGATSPCR
ncbi:MAG: hypothetical protein JSS35_06905 [Proteobacteria bacterium]|nr:hypothetical protein [Pseudomonadota bacterium]